MFNIIPVRLHMLAVLCFMFDDTPPHALRVFVQGEKGDFRFTRYLFIQSSVQLFACILCLAFLWCVPIEHVSLRYHVAEFKTGTLIESRNNACR